MADTAGREEAWRGTHWLRPSPRTAMSEARPASPATKPKPKRKNSNSHDKNKTETKQPTQQKQTNNPPPKQTNNQKRNRQNPQKHQDPWSEAAGGGQSRSREGQSCPSSLHRHSPGAGADGAWAGHSSCPWALNSTTDQPTQKWDGIRNHPQDTLIQTTLSLFRLNWVLLLSNKWLWLQPALVCKELYWGKRWIFFELSIKSVGCRRYWLDSGKTFVTDFL